MSSKVKLNPVKQAVIIEISNDWIKIAQSDPVKGGAAISKLYFEKFDQLDSTLSKSIAKAAKQLKLANIPAIVCIPRQMVTVRMLDLPSTEPDEIADMVELQIGKQVPYSKDEIVSGYKITEASPDGYSKVMLAVVQRAIPRQRYQLLEDAGIEVERMTVTSEGLLNWYKGALSAQNADSAVAVLDVDSFYSDLSVFSGENIISTKSILVGADKLLDNYDKWNGKLVQEIKAALEASRGELSGIKLTKLLIIGAGANVAGLVDNLTAELNIAVEIADPLKSLNKVPAKPSLKDAEYKTLSLSGVIGAALSPSDLSFDLIPDTVVLKKRLIEKARSLTGLAAILMTALVSVSMYSVVKVSSATARLSDVASQISETDPAVAEVERKNGIIQMVRKRQENNFSAINLFSEVHKIVPVNIYLDSVDVNLEAENVVITGTGGSMKEIRELISTLKQSELFKKVAEAGPTSKVSGADRYKFQIVCAMEKE